MKHKVFTGFIQMGIVILSLFPSSYNLFSAVVDGTLAGSLLTNSLSYRLDNGSTNSVHSVINVGTNAGGQFFILSTDQSNGLLNQTSYFTNYLKNWGNLADQFSLRAVKTNKSIGFSGTNWQLWFENLAGDRVTNLMIAPAATNKFRVAILPQPPVHSGDWISFLIAAKSTNSTRWAVNSNTYYGDNGETYGGPTNMGLGRGSLGARYVLFSSNGIIPGDKYIRLEMSSEFYVNDGSLAGDVFCAGAIGSDLNDGQSPATPKRTLTNLLHSYTITPGSTIYVDTGTYAECVRITNNVRGLTNGDITFQGAGINNEISLVTGDAINTSCFYVKNTRFVRITGFKMMHNNRYGVYLVSNCTNIQIDNNSVISNTDSGIYIGNSRFCSIFSNRCSYNGTNGVRLLNARVNMVNGNICNTNVFNGISVEGTSSSNRIAGNLCSSNNSAGILVKANGKGNVLSGNFCRFNKYGMYLNAITNNSIISNFIGCNSKPSGYGIYILGGATNLVMNNLISSNLSGVLSSIYSVKWTFKNNRIYTNVNQGIYLSINAFSSIESNIVWKNGDRGIMLNSQCSNICINRNAIFSNNNYGIQTTGKVINCTNNNVYMNRSYGIWVQGVRSTLSSNSVRRNSTEGIYVDGSCNTIINNTCGTNTGNGIRLNTSSSRSNRILYNTCITNNTGISLQNVSSCTLAGNFASKNLNSGITINSSSNCTLISNNLYLNRTAGIGLSTGSKKNIFRKNGMWKNSGNGIRISGATCSSNSFLNNISYSNTGTGGTGITIIKGSGVNNQFVDNIFFRNSSDGILSGGGSSIFRGNASIQNGRNGITINSNNNNTLISNSCSSNVKYGINLEWGSGTNTIAYNTCITNNRGICLNNSSSCTLIGNRINKNTGAGLDLDFIGLNNVIKSNIVWKNGTNGINLRNNNCKNSFFLDNMAYSNFGIGINCATISNQITGNSVYGNTSDGISSGGGSYVRDNLLFRNGASGLKVSGAGGSRGMIYRNILMRNVSHGISYIADSSASIINNTIYTNGGNGIFINNGSCILGITNTILQGNATGINSIAGNVSIAYSCTNDGISGTIVRGPGNITSSEQFVSTISTAEDFRLLWNSSCQGAGVPSPVFSSSMGSYPLSVIPSSSYVHGFSDHSIQFKTSYIDGAIPGNAEILISYHGPALFKFDNIKVTNTSSWGGTPGTFSCVAAGTQITITRSGGSSTISGSVENLILRGVTNASMIASNYSVTVEIKDSFGKRIDLMEGNQFKLFTNICFTLSKSISNIMLNGSSSTPIPGAVVCYKIAYTNIFNAPGYHAMVIDKLPSKITFSTDFGNANGWILEYSTNVLSDQSYSNLTYSESIPLSKADIKWIRWKKPYLNPQEKFGIFHYNVIIK